MQIKTLIKKENILTFILFFTFFAIRIFRLGSHDLWFDEVGSAAYAKALTPDWNAPLYFIILHYWTKIFGTGEVSLRMPSVIFSFLAVVFTFLIGKKLFNKRVAILSGILIGLSPFHLWYAQEARDYSAVLFFSVLSTYILILASFARTRRSSFVMQGLFIISSACGMFTNYFYIILFIFQLAYLLYSRRLSVKFYLSFVLSVLAFSFYLPLFISKFNVVSEGFWIPRPSWYAPIIILQNFLLGYNGSDLLYWLSGILILLNLFLLLKLVIQDRELGRKIELCLFLFFAPITAVFLFSRIFFSIFLNRGFLIFSPYFYLVLSVGILSVRRWKRIILLGFTGLLVLISVYFYYSDRICPYLEYHQGTYIKRPIKPIAVFLKENVGYGDILAYTNQSTLPGINHYNPDGMSNTYYFFDPQVPDSNWKQPIQEGYLMVPFYKIGRLDFQRLWVLMSDWERSGMFDENSLSVKKWLDENLKIVFRKNFSGLWIFAYEKNP